MIRQIPPKLGIDFVIADADTDVNSLMVTVSSSNSSVVSSSNLNLSGSGAGRNLKISPSGVGLADITVNVSDGINSAAYVIYYAASAASVSPSSTRFFTGASDASTAVAIDSQFMLVADDENQVLRLYDRNNSGLPIAGFDFTTSLALSDTSAGVRGRLIWRHRCVWATASIGWVPSATPAAVIFALTAIACSQRMCQAAVQPPA